MFVYNEEMFTINFQNTAISKLTFRNLLIQKKTLPYLSRLRNIGFDEFIIDRIPLPVPDTSIFGKESK